MKKWGVIGSTVTAVLGQIILISQNKFNIFSILVIFPFAILYYNYSKMK
jgi:hypothetical protein